MKRILEIQAAEGGEDSRLFVEDLANAYTRLGNTFGWKVTVCKSDRSIKLEITGNKLSGLDNEAGGHRIQRIPPTEKRGRVHTSTVTVSVLNPEVINSNNDYKKISDDDFRVEWFSGTGKGGQHRNKKQNSCRLIHIPTGLVESRQGRNRENNLKQAKDSLLTKLEQWDYNAQNAQSSKIVKDQRGSGMRGDKIRTYRFQDDQVIDHNTGKTAKASKVMKGKFDLLW